MARDRHIELPSIKLMETTYRQLEERARSAMLEPHDFIQRALQREANAEYAMPDPGARSIAALSSRLVHLAEELQETRRAFEQAGSEDSDTALRFDHIIKDADSVFSEISRALLDIREAA